MTATVSTPTTPGASVAGALPGFGSLVRKELAEWRRAHRSWMVLAFSTLFLTLAALNSWLQSVLPADVTEGAAPPAFDPLMSLVGPISTHVFVIAAIFAVMALIAAERESGTLAWVASKPVSRSAIWVAKFASASGVMYLLAAAIPLAATVALVTILYGAVPLTTVASVALGMAMIIVLYMAVVLAASPRSARAAMLRRVPCRIAQSAATSHAPVTSASTASIVGDSAITTSPCSAIIRSNQSGGACGCLAAPGSKRKPPLSFSANPLHHHGPL